MEEKNVGGRPTDYRAEFIEEGYRYALLGAIDGQLAQFFDVTVPTLTAWKEKHPEFADALRRGKAVADGNVAKSLYTRATGYEWDEEQAIKVKEVIYSDAGKRLKEIERVEVVRVHKVLPPETVACIFWLKNRRKEDWRDRYEHIGDGGGPIQHNLKIEFVKPGDAQT